MNCPGALPATPKRRAARKQSDPKTKLPPAVAHELDVARAARMGIDISYMLPGERCKYPSKFCCNIRARKSTGKLHRFCEDHRFRANVNQKRWNNVRRRHEQVQQQLVDPVLSSQDESLWTEETAAFFKLELPEVQMTDWDSRCSPSSVAASWPTASNELTDDEIDVLVAMVLNDETIITPSSTASAAAAYWTWHPPTDAETSAASVQQSDAALIYTL